MKRVGIVTMHKVVNYGSALQAWATQEVIRRLGYDVLIIDYVYPNAFHIKDKKRNIARSVLQWCLHFCQGFPCPVAQRFAFQCAGHRPDG